MKSLLVGFSKEDTKRLELHLEKLIKHVDLDDFVLTGGIPIRHHIISNGLNYPKRESNDLDALISTPNSLKASVTKDFQIYHYHLYGDDNRDEKGLVLRDNFYIVLFDPETKTKIDIFDRNPLPTYPIEVDFHGTNLKMRSLEDQLSTKVIETARVLIDTPCDKKWPEDIALLMQIADIEKANSYWQTNVAMPFFKKQSELTGLTSLTDAWEKIQAKLKEKPDLAITKTHKKEKPYECKYCNPLEEFPLTPLEEIYRALGYIE